MIISRVRAAVFTAVAAIAAPLFWAAPASAALLECADKFSTDFNGDGFSDAVVADSYAEVGGAATAGQLIVFYGDADGRIGEGERGTVAQGSGSVGDEPEAGDRFGFSLAVADIDCDSYTDVVVGVPFENLGTDIDAGLVQIVKGGPDGLGINGASEDIAVSDWGGEPRAGDQFGYAVDALEDVEAGGTGAPSAYALAVGAPGLDVGGQNDAGGVFLIAAVDGGTGSSSITQDSPGIPGAAEAGDRFGAALSINYLVGSRGLVDVVVGVPYEDIGSLADAGSVVVLQDLYDPVETGVAIDQNSAGVPGTVEAGDRFGSSLDSVNVIFDSTSRLAVGVPGEDVGAESNAGSVQLFSSNQVTLSPGVGLTQDTAGVSGVAESGDLFGDRLAFGQLGQRSSSVRLAVSSPEEDGAATNTGFVQVFPVTDLDAELNYAQDSPGIPGAASGGDRFGKSLAIVVGASEQALLVGVPDDVDNGAGMVNVIPFGGGVPRYWVPGVGGVPTGASRFGDALGSVAGPA